MYSSQSRLNLLESSGGSKQGKADFNVYSKFLNCPSKQVSSVTNSRPTSSNYFRENERNPYGTTAGNNSSLVLQNYMKQSRKNISLVGGGVPNSTTSG